MEKSTDNLENHLPTPSWKQRWAITLVLFAPLLANILGSAFNIFYNKTQIEPLLSEAQNSRFLHVVGFFNLVVYPLAIACWVFIAMALRTTYQKILYGKPVSKKELEFAQRRAINLPWWFILVAGTAWVMCIPVFLTALLLLPGSLQTLVIVHLPISFLIGGSIAITHSFFLVELSCQSLLFPVLFRNDRAATTPGAWPLSILARSWLWALGAIVCPVSSLVLLLVAPTAVSLSSWFAFLVGALAIVFGVATAVLMTKLVARPLCKLQNAAMQIGQGNLDVQIDEIRADEFGTLIDEFNDMVVAMRERQHLQETLGRHVGHQAAKQILQRDPGLGGVEQEVTIMFVDLRNFTHRAESQPAERIVSLLNIFFTEAVRVVEKHGGMVNKFLGDGFMAIFGVEEQLIEDPERAFAAGVELLQAVELLNRDKLSYGFDTLVIGVGINTGTAIVGSIGAPQRMEYTAIGDTVNVAARVEALTKRLKTSLLVTADTFERLPAGLPLLELEAQRVRGKNEPLRVYQLNDELMSTLTSDSWSWEQTK